MATSTELTDNSMWRNAAMVTLADALDAYLTAQPLTPFQVDLLQPYLATLGAPPQRILADEAL